MNVVFAASLVALRFVHFAASSLDRYRQMLKTIKLNVSWLLLSVLSEINFVGKRYVFKEIRGECFFHDNGVKGSDT